MPTGNLERGTFDIGRGAGVPFDAIPFTAVNATAVAASATPQAIKAAVNGKKHWVTSASYSNGATDAGIPSVADGSTKKAKIQLPVSTTTTLTFNPPIEITADNAINAYVDSNAGDVFITVCGFVEN